MKLLSSFIGTTLLLFLLLAAPTVSVAQVFNEDLLNKNLFLEAVNPYPKPHSTVEVKINDYSYGRSVTGISWSVNGEVMQSAANQRTVFVSVGEAGTVASVSATVTNDNNSTDTVTLQLRPFYVDIVIEPQTRVPSFYKGRSLPSNGSQVTASVLLNGITTGTENFTYTWEVNGKPIDGGAVRGKNKAVFSVPQGREFDLGVSITDLGGVLVARRVIGIPSVEPQIHFYENSALYGVGYRSLQNLILSGETATVRAEPYYLDSITFNNPEHLVWKIDALTTQNPSNNPYEITISRFSDSRRGSTVGFEVRSLSNLLQGTEGSLMVNF